MITTSRRASARRTSRRGLLSAALALAVAAPAAVASTAASAAPTADPDRAAVGYLVDVLEEQDVVTPGNAADLVLAAAAAGSGADAAAASYAGIDRVDDLPAGIAAKVLLAAAAVGDDGQTAQGAEDVVREAIDDEGRIGSLQLFNQALGVLALSTTADGVPEETVDFLTRNACEDGAFVFNPNATTCADGGDVDVTAVVVQALLAAGRDADAEAAIDWLLAQQDPATGGFASSGLVNVNSSALAAQALRAADETEAADEAAAYVATLFEGCATADVATRGSYRFIEDGQNSAFLATSQAVFATAPALDQLTFEGATADTERLNCADTFCPADTGISVAVDLTTLAPDADVDVRCATDLPDDPNGIDVLRAAGFDLRTEDFDFGDGPAEFICTIEGLPQLPEDECFADDGFFGYFNAPLGGDWTSYQVGGSGSSPQVGTIEGWAWAPDFVGGPPRVSTTPAVSQPEPTPTPPFDRGLDAVCPGSYDNTFTDLPADSVHLRAITCLSTTPIVQGTGDGSTFSPGSDVTRDQIASLLARAIERATGSALPTGDVRFDDTEGSVHSDAIHALASAGIIRGTGDGSSFSPREPLERQQMATLLDRMLDFLDSGAVDGSFPPAATTTGVFTDEASPVHAPAIDRLANLGVVTGRPDGTFGPRLNVRRDQVVSFVARALDVAVEEGAAAPVAGS